MNKGINIKKKGASVIILSGFIAAIGFILSCAPPPSRVAPTTPASKWGGNYMYSYEPREKKPAGSVKATIAIVNPFIKDPESALSNPSFLPVGKGFAKSMSIDMDKVIVAKGMTVKGPFSDIEDMTFPDKKGTDLTLTPRIIITAQHQDSEWKVDRYNNRMQRNFKLSIGGFIAFEMREPLSNEKIWIKKLELDGVDVDGVEVYEAVVTRYERRKGLFGEYYQAPVEWKTGKVVYDGKIEAMADALNKMYLAIMGKFETYINSEEILALKVQTKEIRDLKRY